LKEAFAMSNNINTTAMIAALPMTQQKATGSKNGSWFEAMADAWGQALDKQASTIEEKSAAISNGGDTPSAITELSAEAMKMSFLSNSSHTSISSVGTALETMARKQ
jgi:hypothetical protein